MSISPLNNYVLVGLAAKRLQWVFAPKQMVAQIFKLNTIGAGEDSMEVSEDSRLEASEDSRLEASYDICARYCCSAIRNSR